jgi:hypothetical protein
MANMRTSDRASVCGSGEFSLVSIRRNAELAWLAAFLSVLACFAAILWPHLGTHRSKIMLLAAEYLLTLPLLLWTGLRQRKAGAGSGELVRLNTRLEPMMILAYLLITIPLARMLNLGIHHGDESAYLFQARCVQSGALSMAVPVTPGEGNAIFSQHVLYQGRLFGKYPFGWPVVLAAGTITGFEWLVNPLLGLLLLYLARGIAVQALPSVQRTYFSLFYVLSPSFTLNCIGFMSHVLTGVLVAGATLCYLRFIDTRQAKWALGMLVCLAGATTVRPFTAACAGLVLSIALAWNLRRRPAALAALIACGCVLAAMGASTMLFTNYHSTGSYLRSPYSFEGYGTLTNWKELFTSALLGAPRRLSNTGVTSFPFLLLLAGYAIWRRPRELGLLAVLFAALVAGYVIEIESDSLVGERYYFEALFAVAILGVAGWAELSRDWGWQPGWQRTLLAALCVVALAETALCWYWQFEPRSRMERARQIAVQPPFQNGVVFLGDRVRLYNFNRPDKGDVLYLRDPGPLRRRETADGLGAKNWATLQYNETNQTAYWVDSLPRP